MSKPKIGQVVRATSKHPFMPQGKILGTVKAVNGARCWVDDERGETDIFLWKFKGGEKNDYFDWSFEDKETVK